jgi:hypothetical protein
MRPFTIIAAIFLSGCGAPYVYEPDAREQAAYDRIAERLEWYQRHGGDGAHFQY